MFEVHTLCSLLLPNQLFLFAMLKWVFAWLTAFRWFSAISSAFRPRHHFLHDTTAFDAHIYGSGMNEDGCLRPQETQARHIGGNEKLKALKGSTAHLGCCFEGSTACSPSSQ